MLQTTNSRIGYIVKRYPRYSETFIVNEILAHESAGMELSIFALRPPVDSHFQDRIARVRAPVTYLNWERIRGDALWRLIREASNVLPRLLTFLRTEPSADLADVQTASQAIELAMLVREQGVTHLHAHFATSAASVALLAGQLAEVPVTFTAHAKDIFHESVSEEDLASKMMRADGVVTVSDFNVRDLNRRFPDAGHKLQRIYNGLDLDDFPYRSPYQREPKVIAVGRLIEKKGFGDLIEACRLLHHAGTRVQCEIIGGGEEFAALERQIARHKLTSTVKLLGPRPQSEVIRRVTDAAVLAAPCVVGEDGNRDGLPTVLLEAMALGTPTVATPVTGIPEAIEDQVTGLLVPERDAERLANAIGKLLIDADLRERLARNARERIQADFNVANSTAQLRDMFHACQVGNTCRQLQEIH
jgi:glycosyltransferase involved in cell wall biosynthesis